MKEETHIEYKNYWNLFFTLLKKSKQAYCNKYFQPNWNNIKNIWKGIKSLISLKTVASSTPTVLSHDNGITVISPYWFLMQPTSKEEIANISFVTGIFPSLLRTTKAAVSWKFGHCLFLRNYLDVRCGYY